MRKIKMGLMALVAVTGIGSSFAFNSPRKITGATYYGVKINSTTVGWATSREGGSCSSDSQALACTITSTASPSVVENTFNAYPPNTGTKNHLGELNK